MCKYAEAIKYIYSAIERKPNSQLCALLYANSAYCHTQLGNFAQARKDMGISLDMDPFNSTVNSISEFNELTYFQKSTYPMGLDSLHNMFHQYYNETFSINNYSNQDMFMKSDSEVFVSKNLPSLVKYIESLPNEAISGSFLSPLEKGLYFLYRYNYETAMDCLKWASAEDDPSALYYLSAMQFAIGNIKTSYSLAMRAKWNDDDGIILVLSLLLLGSPQLPQQQCQKTLIHSYFNSLISGIYRSLSSSLEDQPIDLGIPSINNGIPKFSFHQNNYPEGFSYELKNPEIISSLITSAAPIGNRFLVVSNSHRQDICIGLAVIQLMQMLKKPKSTSLHKAYSSIGHWIRIFDPMAKLFKRTNDHYYIYFHKNGFDTVLSKYKQNVFGFFKNKFRLISHVEFHEQINSSMSIDDIRPLIKRKIVLYVNSHVSIFYYPESSGDYSFGLLVDPISENNGILSQLSAIWASLMLMIEDNEISYEKCIRFLEKGALFLYHWMLASPISSYSDIIGMVLFRSAMWAFFKKDIISDMPPPIIIQVNTLTLNFFPFFQTSILPKISVSLDPSPSNEEFPSVIENLPTYHHRIQALLNLEFTDSIQNFIDPRDVMEPICGADLNALSH